MTDWLNDYRNRPVPDMKAQSRAQPHPRQYAIDADNPLYHEGFVEARAIGLKGANYYHTPPNPPYHVCVEGSIDSLFLRKTVADKLVAINAQLAPHKLELWIYDAWRPIAVQNYFYDIWFPRWLQGQDPSLQGEALWEEVGKYWAKGAKDGKVDPASPPPHYTGGAVDLTIRHTSGEPLWMGTIFDDVTERANTAHYELHPPERSFSDLEARANRRLLFHLMAAHGFVNVWSEWWHYSWGDQRWAVTTGAPAAHYGPMNPLK
jgi:D-alanyl-D-alanine dipeptidase